MLIFDIFIKLNLPSLIITLANWIILKANNKSIRLRNCISKDITYPVSIKTNGINRNYIY